MKRAATRAPKRPKLTVAPLHLNWYPIFESALEQELGYALRRFDKHREKPLITDESLHQELVEHLTEHAMNAVSNLIAPETGAEESER